MRINFSSFVCNDSELILLTYLVYLDISIAKVSLNCYDLPVSIAVMISESVQLVFNY